MKRFLAVFLALLTLLGTASCAVAPDDERKEASATIPAADLSALAEQTGANAPTVRICSSDDAYVRTGSNANLNFLDTRKETGFLELKNDGPTSSNSREILLRFNLYDINLYGIQTIYLYLTAKNNISAKSGTEDLYVLAYKVSNDWDPATVTYNTAPAYTEADLAGKVAANGLNVVQIDVTDAIFDAIDRGEHEISFRICSSTVSVSQLQVYSGDHKDENMRPKLVCTSSTAEATYEKKLVADETENAAIWAHAEKLVDEWFARYEEIKAKGDYDYTPVTPDASQYVTTVKAHGSNGEWIDFPTRLVSGLEGYNETIYETDRYGGVLAGDKQEATGYYYTKKIGDRWWLVDPLGNLCYIRGTTHLKYAYVATSTLETEATPRVFGSFEKWAIAATRWITKDLGFNVAYEASSQVNSVENNIPLITNMGGVVGYASSLDLRIPNDGGVPEFAGGIMPVFDPGFETYIDGRAKNAAAQSAGRSDILGYFSDNEIMVADDMLSSYLNADYSVPTSMYSYAAAWTWYTRITGEEYPRIIDIDKHSDRLGVDLWDLFKGFLYDRYFSVCATAIKTYDPNRIYFGNRFFTACKKWEWMMRFTGYWVDVLCINYYYEWEIPTTRDDPGRPSLDQLGRWVGKPFLVTEFYAKGNDALNGYGEPMDNVGGAGWVVQTQTDRGYFYQNYTLKLLECKFSIGWMQFQYVDNDPTDQMANSGAAQNSNKGLVDWQHDFDVYSDFTKQVELINKNVYSLIEYFDGVNYFSK